MMSNEVRSDWKDFAATAIAFLVSGAFMVFLIMPIPGFQEDLVLSGILAAIIYIIVLIVTLLALKKDEMKRICYTTEKRKTQYRCVSQLAVPEFWPKFYKHTF